MGRTLADPEYRISPDWGDSTVGSLNGEIGRRLADLLVSIAREHTDVRSICDLGCGNGYLARRLGALGYRVVGVDGSRPYIDTARRTNSLPNVTFKRGFFGPDVESELLREGPFDLVLSSDVIEHLYRPSDLLDTAKALLSVGGILVLGTPYHGYWKNLAISLLDRWDAHHGVHWEGGHIKFFSPRSLSTLVRTHGFEDLRFQYYGRVPGFWKNMICIARKAG